MTGRFTSLVGSRAWFKNEFTPQTRAREVGYQAGTILACDFDSLLGEERVELQADDGATFDTRLSFLRLTAPPGLSQRRETTAPAKPKARRRAIDPRSGEELELPL